MRSLLPVFVLLVFMPAGVRGQFWEREANFAPVLESPWPSYIHTVFDAGGGRILVRPPYAVNGVRTSLARLNADGSIDPTFAPASPDVTTVLLTYPDGRVLIARHVSAGATLQGTVARLRSDGSDDPSFTTVNTTGNVPMAAVLMRNGRILLIGQFTQVGTLTTPSLAVLEPDGTVSPAFRSPFSSIIAGGDLGELAATPAPSGQIYITGPFDGLGAARLSRIARLNPDGSVDPTFNATGVTFPSFPARCYEQADGRVTVICAPGFMTGGTPGIVRLDATGRRDTSYTPELIGVPQEFGAQQSNGQIVYVTLVGDHYEVRRIGGEGSADPTFVLSTTSGTPPPLQVADGTYYFRSPLTAARQANRFTFTHVLADGTIDAGFNPRFANEALVDAFARQDTGDVLLAGSFPMVSGTPIPAWPAIIRLKPDGAFDPLFLTPLSTGERVTRLAARPDGTVFAIGSFTVDGQTRSLIRLNADGSRDSGFPLRDLSHTNIVFDNNGRIYNVAGDTHDLRVERYTADGTRDSTFVPRPLAAPGLFATDRSGRVIATVPAAPPNAKPTLIRYAVDGAVDPTFRIDSAELPETLLRLVATPDAGVVAIGLDRTRHSFASSYTRFGPTGAVELRFRGSGGMWTDSGFDHEELAGVLFDALHESSSAAPASLNVSLNGTTVDVDAEGRLLSLRNYKVTAQRRTTRTSPSVDMLPRSVETWNADPGEVAIGGTTSLEVIGGGMLPLSYQWEKNGVPIPGATAATFTLSGAQPASAGDYTVTLTNPYGTSTSPPVTVRILEPRSAPSFTSNTSFYVEPVAPGTAITLAAEATGNPLPSFTWLRNGEPVPRGAQRDHATRTTASSTFSLPAVHPTDAGLYTVAAGSGTGNVTSRPVILGARSTLKTTGDGSEVATDVTHPNGRVYDQLLLEGAVASLTADPGQVARMSFVDLDDDIVQVEFTGAGTLTLRLTAVTGPAAPALYEQPAVAYMKGHAMITIVGANEHSHLSVFTVGRANAMNRALFREGANYDGIADLAAIAILSDDGKFGSLRCGNVNFFASRGLTGVYAPLVQFTGPIYVGDIIAFDNASPVLQFGWAHDGTRITGGALRQANNESVVVSGISRLEFTAGTTSHGTVLPAQQNKARLVQNGVDVTDQIVVGPTP